MSSETMNRRKVLQACGALGALSLAGCPEGGSSSEELGERVPDEDFYISSVPGAAGEQTAPLVTDYAEEIGLPLDPMASADNLVSDAVEDRLTEGSARNGILLTTAYTFPHRMWGAALVDTYELNPQRGAGPTNFYTIPKPWQCEYHNQVQRTIQADEENYQDEFDTCQEIFSESAATAPIVDFGSFGAARTDLVNNIDEIGRMGVDRNNHLIHIRCTPEEGDSLIVEGEQSATEEPNFVVTSGGNTLMPWSQLINSRLVSYDGDWERMNVLADEVRLNTGDYDVEIAVRDDALWHNGDSVTAEDVAFSFEFYEANQAQSNLRRSAEYEDIDVLDETTVGLNMGVPIPYWRNYVLVRWPPLHRETWEDVDPAEPASDLNLLEEDVPGCGPFTLENIEPGASMSLRPFEDHPVWDVDHNVEMVVYANEPTKMEAFEAGELHTVGNLSPGAFTTADEMENATTTFGRGIFPLYVYMDAMKPPFKFLELRQAFGMALNRSEINQIVYHGMANEQLGPTYPGQEHPDVRDSTIERAWQFTDDPSGDIEGARQLLEENGWGWDSDGNLHYPPDADLSPAWAPDGEWDPANWECIDDDKNLIEQ